MYGLLNINKPGGMTSRAVVDEVQRRVRGEKVGHAGTLDPLASGVLVVCLGRATRLIQYVQAMPKRYRATFLLGHRSETDDVEGMVEELVGAAKPSQGDIEAALPRWIGQTQQQPPLYSAVKIKGERAYNLARRGKAVQPQSRPVTIYELKLLRYAYPELELEIACGSGTYVRSIGRDLAAALGTAAVMSALVRTAVGAFRLEQACALEEVCSRSPSDLLIPAAAAVAHLPRINLSESEAARIARGMFIEAPSSDLGTGEIAAFDEQDRLIAILTPTGQKQLRPIRNLV